MNENELLLRHAERWASDRNRPWDADLTDLALRLRGDHDGLDPNRWPAGSVQHLMLSRWPSHGPVGVPDVAALTGTLETFWRFLRTTGRMGGGSAEPAALVREAKHAAKKMAAACEDLSLFGPSKTMLAFGEEIGISLDDVEDMDAANQRLEQIQEAWNALPIQERRRRSPGLDRPGVPTHDARDWYGPGADAEDDEPLFPNEPSVSAPQVRACAFVQSMMAMSEWVGDGRPVTQAGVLRPGVAREAYDALDLWEWERPFVMRSFSFLAWQRGTPRDEEKLRHDALNAWRSAMDSLPLDRLWTAVVGAGWVTVGSSKARAVPDALPTDDRGWVTLGLQAVAQTAVMARDRGCVGPLLGILLQVSAQYGGPQSVAALKDWWWQSPANDLADDLNFSTTARAWSDSDVDRCLAMFDDLGLWTESDGVLVGTEFGWDAALMVARLTEDDVI